MRRNCVKFVNTIICAYNQGAINVLYVDCGNYSHDSAAYLLAVQRPVSLAPRLSAHRCRPFSF